MTSKSVAVSVRLSQEDAEFVTSFDTPDASTPSDKLRAIIAELREIKSSMHDYGNSLVTLKNLVQDTQQRLLTSERKLNLHSDVTAKIGEWLPEIMAFYMTAVSAGKKENRPENAGNFRGWTVKESFLPLFPYDEARDYRRITDL